MRWVGAVALCAVACGGVEDVSGDAADETIESGVPHALPFARGESAAPAASPKLVYYGGPVLEKASVVAVLWGPSVDAEVAARIGDFYKAVVSSSYFSWLSEYDSARQHIGRGSLAGVFTIAPSKKGRALTDAQIEKELAAQIRKRALPAADANTIYLIHFPPGVRITMGGSASCQAGGFCGYHSTSRPPPIPTSASPSASPRRSPGTTGTTARSATSAPAMTARCARAALCGRCKSSGPTRRAPASSRGTDRADFNCSPAAAVRDAPWPSVAQAGRCAAPAQVDQ
jgi:hypothetical protein